MGESRYSRLKIMTPLYLLITVKGSSKSSFTEYVTIISHLTNSQWVLSYCVKFKPVPRIDKKPRTSQLRVLFYHYITRSLIYIVLFCLVSEMAQ